MTRSSTAKSRNKNSVPDRNSVPATDQKSRAIPEHNYRRQEYELSRDNAITPDRPALSPLAYRVNEFCLAIGISRSNFYVQVKEGNIRTVVIGGRRLIPSDEVQRLLTSVDQQTSTLSINQK